MSTTSSDRENSEAETSPREQDTESSRTKREIGSDCIASGLDTDSNGGYATDHSEAVDVQPYDSDDSLGSANEDWEESSVASSAYGGRGEPEIVNHMKYVLGDIIEFEFEEKHFQVKF